MKKSVQLLMIVFIAFSCNSEQSRLKSDLQSGNLKGNVWKIDKTIHKTGNTCGCVLKTECNQSKYVYNEKGNLVEWYTIDENGSINDSSEYIYNKHGLCSEIVMFSGKKSIGRQVAVFQGEKVTGYKIYNENGIHETTLDYVYSGNEITEEKTLNSNGDVIGTIQKEFFKGQLVSESEKDNKGNVKSTSKFKRNASNDIIERLILVTKDNKVFKLTYEYEYDNAGNWTKQTQFLDGAIINIVIRNIEYFNS
jgi:hypothetical protein